ncbi:MAG: hypothetical protein H6742_01550 [Alphaproteobacteria bacterium]|nr:hypothetical protein [Alphaproteobacteria bacterium]
MRDARASSLIALLLAGCGGAYEAGDAAPASVEQDYSEEELAQSAPMAPAPSGGAKREANMRGGMGKDKATLADDEDGWGGGEGAPEPEEVAKKPTDDGESAQAPTRSWFPETFLFEPVVVTDQQGRADVPVVVPDRLTDWRVLALAHDRQGHQAGDLTTFRGTLPVYVEPVLPPFLVAGDRIVLPLQVVNTTEAAWSGTLDVDITGATDAHWSGPVSIPAGGSRVLPVPLSAPRAGELKVSLALGDADAVVRTLPVQPSGKRIEQVRTGTLAAERSFELEGDRDLDPDSARVRVAVSPGAISLLRRELARTAAGGGSPATDAYGLLLSGAAPDLLAALGEPVDDARQDALDDMTKVSTQRVLRHARAPDLTTAMILLPGAAAHPDAPVLARLRDRLADQLARGQRPDGTVMDGSGWTVQRMLAATALATAAVRDAAADDAGHRRADRMRIAAGAAFERQAAQIRDPYTAALVLRSGAASPGLEATLRAMVRGAISDADDGSKRMTVPTDARRPDGSRPTGAECTALAALVLADSEPAVAADLAAGVLGAWRAGFGWGDGQTDLVATQAVARLLRDPLPDEISVVVSRDGEEVTRGVLTGDRRSELLVLDAAGGSARGMHRWSVRAEPAVPGLAFSFALQSWVPWPDADPAAGVEVELDLPAGMRVGRKAGLQLSIAAPARTALDVELPLPAGVQVDGDALDALVSAGDLSGWNSQDGLLELSLPGRDATSWRATIPVVPTLQGTLHAAAVQVTLPLRPDLELATPQGVWTVAGASGS